MNTAMSWARKKCIDPDNRHKKKKYEDSHSRFTQLGDRVDDVKKLYPGSDYTETDFLCGYCNDAINVKIDGMSSSGSSQQPSESGSHFSSQGFSDPELINTIKRDAVEDLNELSKDLKLKISPLKLPGSVNVCVKNAYVTRKRKEIVSALDLNVSKKMKLAYEISEVDEINPEECSKCNTFIENIKAGLKSCSSIGEKIRLLSILPSDYSKQTILNFFPNVTAYMIDQARSSSKVEIYKKPDYYSGRTLPVETLNTVQKYYLDDDFDCTRQSPNKNDTVSVKENGVKVLKVKRFATRSLNEMYKLFREKNPEIKIGRTKFYELRPKWVKLTPPSDTCLCVYCENFHLMVVALKKIKKDSGDLQLIKTTLLSLITCSLENLNCALQNCENCPGKEAIDVDSLGFEMEDEHDEVTYSFWDKNDLQIKCVTMENFICELQEYSLIYLTHNRIKEIQRVAIKEIKVFAKTNSGRLVLHVDFAENWTVILKNPIQSYHWSKKQISIFTAVAYYQNEKTMSFAVVSDDRKHDTAHALMATNLILQNIKQQCAVQTFEEIIMISDGAASQFKNRFQFHELLNTGINKRWLFSATGHGKGACNGIGGLVKSYASKHNLSNENLEFIRQADDFVHHMPSYTSAISVILLPVSDLEGFREKKLIEWENVPKVPGIQKIHNWKMENNKLYTARTAEHEWLEMNR